MKKLLFLIFFLLILFFLAYSFFPKKEFKLIEGMANFTELKMEGKLNEFLKDCLRYSVGREYVICCAYVDGIKDCTEKEKFQIGESLIIVTNLTKFGDHEPFYACLESPLFQDIKIYIDTLYSPNFECGKFLEPPRWFIHAGYVKDITGRTAILNVYVTKEEFLSLQDFKNYIANHPETKVLTIERMVV